MAEHNVTFELFYDGAWNPAPALTRDRVTCMRGSKSPGNDTDPGVGSLTLDNTSELYAPRSVKSGLYGKIGQNTPGRISADGSVRMTGEAASWKPQRPVRGSGWTSVQLAGVLRRLGRGTDPLQSTMRRSYDNDATQPVAYWPLEEGKGSTVAYDTITGAPSAVGGFTGLVTDNAGAPQFGVADLGPGSAPVANIAGGWNLDLNLPKVTATSQVALQFSEAFGTTVRTGTYTRAGIRLDPAAAPRHLSWAVYVNDSGLIEVQWLEAGADFSLLAGPTTVYSAGSENIFDGRPRIFELDLSTSGATNVTWALYENGTLLGSGTITPSFSGAMNAAPYRVAAFSGAAADQTAALGHVAVYNTIAIPSRNNVLTAYAGETAADRFTRLCTEFGINATVGGLPAESMPMGAQSADPLLDQLDEIARTDDASIFETRDALGLTMRTGSSKLNQAPALTLNYLGQIMPPLLPVFGDEGVRNDVTAKAPNGATRRVQQLTGPRNVLAPGTDPQGVGRYQTSLDVNPATEAALADEAGWRINLGTFNGTWYAEVTVDLDAAPSKTAAVNAVDIGQVIAIANLPADEALDTVEGLVIGIEEDLPPKRRLVTFYLVPADPYRVGKLAQTTGDTDPIVGYTESDGATTAASVAAGAASFTVAIPSGPLWTVVADDFPQDVVVGGQRITLGSVTGASSPQTFSVRSAALGGRQILYPIPSGASVSVFQPLILTL